MRRELRPETRFHARFPVHLAWQDARGALHRTRAVCADLSASGMRVETMDAFEPGSAVMVTSVKFGRMGNASVRYCRREGMKYGVGLQFSIAFPLGDPVRRAIVETVL